MIRTFRDCLEKEFAVEKQPDPAEANAFIKRAQERLTYIKSQDIEGGNAAFIFEDIYECMREAAQALMSLKGYKPHKHFALLSFLNEYYNLSEQDLTTFDRFRILRNEIKYGVADLTADECKDALEFLEEFLPKLIAEARS